MKHGGIFGVALLVLARPLFAAEDLPPFPLRGEGGREAWILVLPKTRATRDPALGLDATFGFFAGTGRPRPAARFGGQTRMPLRRGVRLSLFLSGGAVLGEETRFEDRARIERVGDQDVLFVDSVAVTTWRLDGVFAAGAGLAGTLARPAGLLVESVVTLGGGWLDGPAAILGVRLESSARAGSLRLAVGLGCEGWWAEASRLSALLALSVSVEF